MSSTFSTKLTLPSNTDSSLSSFASNSSDLHLLRNKTAALA